MIRKTHSKEKTTYFYVLLSILIMVILTIVSLIYYYSKLKQITLVEATGSRTYSKHYAMITDSTETEYWDQVYVGALEEAKQHDAYVERIGESMELNSEVDDLLRIAINSSVDGIIVPGSEDEERVRLINEAVEKGITVVTVGRDAIKSNRQCYVGINNYNLGKEYGKQIITLNEEREKKIRKVYVLVEEVSTDTSQSITMLGLQETIEKQYGKDSGIEVNAIPVNNKSTFGADESIRDVFMKANQLPDVLVCLNATYTQCAYQAAVNYNMVGEVAILGYYNSDAILSAVAKDIVQATIGIDTRQMGALCLQALKEYENAGYVSTYEPVKTSLITQREALERLEAQEKEQSLE